MKSEDEAMQEEMTEAREDAIYTYQDQKRAAQRDRDAEIEAERKGDCERDEK